MSDAKYNGWRNFETWQAAMWLDNDGTLAMLREYDNLTDSLVGDILTSWLHCVRVSKIIEHVPEA